MRFSLVEVRNCKKYDGDMDIILEDVSTTMLNKSALELSGTIILKRKLDKSLSVRNLLFIALVLYVN